MNVKNKTPVIIQYRDLNDGVVNNICADLYGHDWSILKNMNVEQSYDYFITALNNIIEIYAPMKSKKLKYKKVVYNPWMTSGLSKSSYHKDKLYRMSINKPKDSHEAITYRNYRNFLNKRNRLLWQFV